MLDTNVVSELQKPHPSGLVGKWLASTSIETTYICGPVLMAQAFGAELHLLKSGSRRYVDGLERLRAQYADRTLVLDAAAYDLAGRLRARRQSRGRPLSIGDSMIAAICLAHGAALATRNVRDFDGLDLRLINPFEPGA
ncbi:MAG TPA: PIN domain-containing protein [Rhizobiaceae bacterium]